MAGKVFLRPARTKWRRPVRRFRAGVAAGVLAAAWLVAPAAFAAETGVTLQDGWIRVLLPERPAAAYFTLRNDTAAERALVGARSPACGSLMLHQSVTQGGMDRMMMVARVPVPAHGTLSFAPGGYHLMCMQPRASLAPGGRAPVTLLFGDGGSVTADFAVRGATGR
jgi:copper(I)-binding protein